MDKYEHLIKIIPLLSIFLIFFGFLNLYTYYFHFGINIYPFLNSSEIIFSFLPSLQSFFLTSTIIIIFIVFLYALILRGKYVVITSTFKLSSENSLADILDRLKWENWKKLPWKEKIGSVVAIFKHGMVVMLLLLVIFTYLMVGDNFLCGDTISHFILLWTWAIFCSLLMYSFFRENPFIRNSLILVVIGFFLSIFFFSKNSCKADQIKGGQSNRHVSFSFKDSVIRTDSTKSYVGSTQEYIFIYDRDDNATIIYDKSYISWIKYK